MREGEREAYEEGMSSRGRIAPCWFTLKICVVLSSNSSNSSNNKEKGEEKVAER